MQAIRNNSARMVVGSARSLGLALALAAGAGAQAAAPVAPAAPAQPETRTLEGDFSKPLSSTRSKGEGSSYSTLTYIQQDGDDTLKVTVINDQVSAEVNGKPVPPERIVREGDSVRIMGENGKPIGGAIQLGKGTTGLSGPARVRVRGLDPLGGLAVTEAGDPPPVMLGVTMSEADANLLKHLGIEGGAAIQIDTVRDNLPAAKAGLKSEDLIVAINGQSPATQQKLREILRASKPGDELKLSIVRRGKSEDLSVKLEAYDAALLGQRIAVGRSLEPGPFGGLGENPGWLELNSEETKAKFDQARAAIEEALKNIKESAKFDSEKIREQVAETLQKAMEHLHEEHDNLARRWNLWTVPAPAAPGAPQALIAPEGGMVFTPMQGGQTFKRIEAVEERLERMEKSLDAILKKLDEKK